MRLKRRIWWRIIPIVLLCVTISGFALSRREPLLLERATKVADVKGWWPSDNSGSEYYWVSDTVLFTGSETWRLANPFLYDIRSRQRTPLPQLSQDLRRDSDLGTRSWTLSPDRKWLLWTMELYDDVRAARLDGSGYQVVAMPPPGNTVGKIGWEEDSRHWRAEGFDYDSGKVTNCFGGDVEAPGHRRSFALTMGGSFFDKHTPEFDAKGRLVTAEGVQKAPITSQKRASIGLVLNGGTSVIEVAPNHRGDRVAWVLRSTQEPPFTRWLRHVFPRGVRPAADTAEIWTGRLDGSERHEVGRLVFADSGDQENVPDDLQWLPSEKSLSFRYKDALWTVPAA
jgi:hypothetical protein